MLQVTSFKLQYYKLTIPDYGEIVWNINRAKECVARGEVHEPTPKLVSPEELRNIMGRTKWDEAHLPLVDPTQPGIAAPFIHEGRVIWIPIDGMHRIVRAVREHLPFSMWMLTEAASRSCIISGPLDRIP